VYSTAQIQAVADCTKDQSNTELWHDHRVGVITASVAHSVYTRINTIQKDGRNDATNAISRIMGYTKLNPNLAPLKYGRNMEGEARRQYEKVMKSTGHDVQVTQTGLVLHPTKVYIGASPDGLVSCTCCGDGLVEIQCPLNISCAVPTADNQDCLQKIDGQTHISKAHSYYTQVQCQLAVTKREWCDFCIYTKNGHFLDRVYFDNVHWQKVEQNCDQFFTKYLVEEMVSQTLVHVVFPAPCHQTINTEVTYTTRFLTPMQSVLACERKYY
jgi:hypothetical protein